MFGHSSEDITDGPLHRALLFLTVPLLAQNVVRAAQQVIDLFWLGRLSENAVAAVGFATPILGLLLAAVIPIPFVGTQVLVSQRIGADDESMARRLAFVGLAVASVLGVGFGVVTFFGVGWIIEIFADVNPQQSSGAVPDLAVAYLKVLALGVVFAALSDVIEAAFIGWGNSRVALYMNVAAVVVNVVLDPLLIFGYGPFEALGIRGAALATVAGYGAGLLLGVGFVVSKRYENVLSLDQTVVSWDDATQLIEVGAPPAAQDAAQQIARIAIVVLIFSIGGPAALAAYIVGSRVASMAFIPAHGLQQAVQSVVGQNLGARKPGRASRTVWLGVSFSAGVLFLAGGVQWLFPELITNLFLSPSATESFALSVEYLRIFAISYPAIGAIFLLQGGFNGAKKTRVSFASSIVQYWLIRLPAAATVGLVLDYDVLAVFWAITLSNVAVAFGLAGFFLYADQSGMMGRVSEKVSASNAG